ncbi:hypothetical protein [Streptosporangium carneum]|uniref:Uncharacterized protein n=1 Tax=Streptosporangium carneum TaxID=47481 RepID=A0A9W6I058_9ACTN|nr:hypothetical protein [Streptosporangium carneum]GLK09572.1 hypothetical protein GCM10017600_29780 [Streptosporangium carneum]
MKRARRVKATPKNQEWLLTLLPVFPLVLLVVRLWYASRQDTQTLLLLLQSISPLGLLSVALLTALWVLPALVLGGKVLGTLYWISARRSSWLVRAAERLPGWVVILAVAVGLFSWQLRFLPTLAMLALAAAGLTVRDRFPHREELRIAFCYALPAMAAILSYVALWPAIAAAVAAHDVATALLLTLPPGAAVLLTGPVPEVPARMLTHGIAVAIAVFAPFLVGVVVMRAPILPLTALQVSENGSPRVLVGYLVASDDQMFTVLGRDGGVSFVENGTLQSRVLCPDPGAVPRTSVNLHGWYVEQNVASWLAPTRPVQPVDPRCQGRSVKDPGAAPG